MILDDYTICYHGTIKRDGEYIREQGIDLNKSRYATDFGKGFYVTNNLKQAEKWAQIKHLDYKDSLSTDDSKPVVMYFLLNAKLLNNLNGIHFKEADNNWGEFILESRVKGMSKQISHTYDYVKGPLADGKLMPLLKRYISGKINKTAFIKGIMPKSVTHQQMSLHSNRAIQCLDFMEVKEIEL